MQIQIARQQILEALRLHGSMSMDALAEFLQRSKTATRAHVVQLEESGLVTRETAPPSGPGRPPVHFALTKQGGSVFPTRDSDILTGFLDYLNQEGHAHLIEEFFRRIWAERRETLLQDLGTGSFAQVSQKKRLSSLKVLLDESEFMPRIEESKEKGRRSVVVRECNCPLPAAVRATKIPCKLEAEFLEEVVGGRLTKAQVASNRAGVCSFEFRSEPPDVTKR